MHFCLSLQGPTGLVGDVGLPGPQGQQGPQGPSGRSIIGPPVRQTYKSHSVQIAIILIVVSL